MAIKTEPVRTEDLRYVARQTAAGVSNAALAADLNVSGVLLPRQDSKLPPYALRYSHGYALNTDAGTPSRWTAATVAELKTAAEYSTSGDYVSSGNPATLVLSIT